MSAAYISLELVWISAYVQIAIDIPKVTRNHSNPPNNPMLLFAITSGY